MFILALGVAGQEQPAQSAHGAAPANSAAEKPEAKEATQPPVPLKISYSDVLPDDSYLVELASNIEAGHLHTIAACTRYRRPSKDLMCGFTQEFAVKDGKYMFSYTAPVSSLDSHRIVGLGDVALNFRYQMTGDENWAVISPRFSLLIPTGNKDQGLGTGATGMQFNLPVTKRLSESFLGSFNAGVTFLPKVKGEDSAGKIVRRNLTSYNLGGSLVWVARKHINPLIEYVANFAGEINEEGRIARHTEHIISPGIGLAWESKHIKISPGMAVPVSFSQGAIRTGLFFYLAFEHPLKRHKVELATK